MHFPCHCANKNGHSCPVLFRVLHSVIYVHQAVFDVGQNRLEYDVCVNHKKSHCK